MIPIRGGQGGMPANRRQVHRVGNSACPDSYRDSKAGDNKQRVRLGQITFSYCWQWF